MNRFFITGTDTDCGKTYVTCYLLNELKRIGKKALAIKPVASGLEDRDGILINTDVEALKASNGPNDFNINPWLFKPPVSPHLAGGSLSAEEIAQYCLSQDFSSLDCLLIEGAGGLMVPLNNHETWVDMLRLSNIPVILVVGMKLGCLNHTLLTQQVLATNNLVCAGWVANCLDEDMLMLEENISTLEQAMSAPCLARVGYTGEGSKLMACAWV
jgi:dethiobiotin synthetase